MVVLVVDDDSVSRLVTEYMLRDGGWDVQSAASAAEARELVSNASEPVGAIVCDYNMPESNGLDLLEQLEGECDTVPPFVLLTGVATAESLDDPRSGRATAYLTKPVQSEELVALVNELME